MGSYNFFIAEICEQCVISRKKLEEYETRIDKLTMELSYEKRKLRILELEHTGKFLYV